MGATAENVAELLGITRKEQDEFSYMSQTRAIAAIDEGRFKEEIVPVIVPQGKKKPPVVFDTDEFPKRDTNMEAMAKLRPCFNIKKDEKRAGCGTTRPSPAPSPPPPPPAATTALPSAR